MELGLADTIWLYLISLVILLILDAFWIGVLAQEFYQKEMKKILRRKPILPAVFTLYAVLAGAYVYFAVWPALDVQSFGKALINGMLLGLSMFGLYSLSAYALVNNWSRRLAVVDILWGLVVSVIVTGGTYLVFELLF